MELDATLQKVGPDQTMVMGGYTTRTRFSKGCQASSSHSHVPPMAHGQ